MPGFITSNSISLPSYLPIHIYTGHYIAGHWNVILHSRMTSRLPDFFLNAALLYKPHNTSKTSDNYYTLVQNSYEKNTLPEAPPFT